MVPSLTVKEIPGLNFELTCFNVDLAAGTKVEDRTAMKLQMDANGRNTSSEVQRTKVS